MALLLVLEALQLQVALLLDPLGQRRRVRAQGRQQPGLICGQPSGWTVAHM
jgi:hypothetical protein